MYIDKVSKVFLKQKKFKQNNFDYNPRLWHALNRLNRVNPKYKQLSKIQVEMLNRYVHQEIIINKKLFSETFNIS